jgi:hypothetical protein
MKNKKLLVLGIALILIATVAGSVFAYVGSWNVVYGGGQRTLILYNNTDKNISVEVPNVVTANGERFTARLSTWPGSHDIWLPGNGSKITSFGQAKFVSEW